MTANGVRPFDIWLAGVSIGLRSVRKEPVLGLKRLALPASYWRMAEFAYVWQQLEARRGARILDVGSPKELAFMLARSRGCEIVAADILPEAIALSRRYARAQGMDGTGPGNVHSEVQDGRSLTYAENSFDAAYSISVVEHIPDRGDSAAISELLRVVKPGGVVVVTVPYDRMYRETFVDGPVYERQQVGSQKVFFERHYDERTLAERLLAPARARLIDRRLWGEGYVRIETILTRLGPLRTPLSPLEPLLSRIFLRQIEADGPGHPMAAFLTFKKLQSAV